MLQKESLVFLLLLKWSKANDGNNISWHPSSIKIIISTCIWFWSKMKHSELNWFMTTMLQIGFYIHHRKGVSSAPSHFWDFEYFRSPPSPIAFGIYLYWNVTNCIGIRYTCMYNLAVYGFVAYMPIKNQNGWFAPPAI